MTSDKYIYIYIAHTTNFIHVYINNIWDIHKAGWCLYVNDGANLALFTCWLYLYICTEIFFVPVRKMAIILLVLFHAYYSRLQHPRRHLDDGFLITCSMVKCTGSSPAMRLYFFLRKSAVIKTQSQWYTTKEEHSCGPAHWDIYDSVMSDFNNRRLKLMLVRLRNIFMCALEPYKQNLPRYRLSLGHVRFIMYSFIYFLRIFPLYDCGPH